MRKVKVCIKFDSKEVEGAMKRAVGLIDVDLVEKPIEADLIIVDSHNRVGEFYSAEKYFGILSIDKIEKILPENVRVFSISTSVPDCLNLITEISEKIKGIEVGEEMKVGELLSDAKKILVIEDTIKHQKSARILLKGHRLTIASGYDEAMEIMGKEKFEVVLSDLYLPMSPKTLSEKAFEIGKPTNYGILLILEAARHGTKLIAVATDLGHHDDPFAAAFDHFSKFTWSMENAKVKFMHAPMVQMGGEYVKDWAKVLEIISE